MVHSLPSISDKVKHVHFDTERMAKELEVFIYSFDNASLSMNPESLSNEQNKSSKDMNIWKEFHLQFHLLLPMLRKIIGKQC